MILRKNLNRAASIKSRLFLAEELRAVPMLNKPIWALKSLSEPSFILPLLLTACLILQSSASMAVRLAEVYLARCLVRCSNLPTYWPQIGSNDKSSPSYSTSLQAEARCESPSAARTFWQVFCIFVWVKYFYNVKQECQHHIKTSPTEQKDFGKIVIVQNTLQVVTNSN